ncbi:flagellar basal-body rod protein FlgG [Acidovorax sp. NCPPB 4044]|uniref:flagellar basal-body rod protein FlgG n=1 Tax=Acidovorax sp. NCPPB 4044 TaxID=2940490 RepID=UPI00230413A9|nr:flagellar basal-body rod protein FlgG [Acidovorax sp. NCPPB 4044]MDA8521034.1 flagellar basal-body rod protein FlgG [Acidovorax sp. NCPPB 4044]
MFDALYIGATGMQAQQLNVETIANNLANVNTAGYKRARVSFSDLVARDPARTAGPGDADAGLLQPTLRLGSGVGIASVSKLFDLGDAKKTDAPLDITVQGEGFFEVLMPDGSSAYTRGGTWKVNKDGQLATLAGLPLKPGIQVPEDIQALVVQPDGRVQAKVANQANAVDLGRIELVRFTSPQGLLAQGDNVYRSSSASGEALPVRAGEEGAGQIAQGYLEGSNVKMVDEMVNLMVAQRTYEANAKIVQAADEILGLVNGLRR